MIAMREQGTKRATSKELSRMHTVDEHASDPRGQDCRPSHVAE